MTCYLLWPSAPLHCQVALCEHHSLHACMPYSRSCGKPPCTKARQHQGKWLMVGPATASHVPFITLLCHFCALPALRRRARQHATQVAATKPLQSAARQGAAAPLTNQRLPRCSSLGPGSATAARCSTSRPPIANPANRQRLGDTPVAAHALEPCSRGRPYELAG
jgi:hypothetical protein